ncbi:PAS domain-containing sensor histidine kinase [Hydrogenophaga sp.]|uniref:sensor histidine kinase n=1 Tax=Hydrogenophaga sp. TaxID=1904254 RepID=UPI0025BEBCFC|nr:PAS domain-containing sensor histidine kinase [Hydrogenophaga sp.]
MVAATSDLLRLAVEVEELAHPLQQALHTLLRATGSREGLLAELSWDEDRQTRLQPVASLRLVPGSPPARDLSPPLSSPAGLALRLEQLDNGAIIESPLECLLAPGHPESTAAPGLPRIAYVFGRENTGHYLLVLDRHLGSVGLADNDSADLLFQALETLFHGWKLSSMRASTEALLEQALASDTQADTGTHHLFDHLRQGVIQIDVNGYVEFISPPALRLLGLSHLPFSQQTHFSALLSSACSLFDPHPSALPDHLRWIFEQRTLPTVDSIPRRFVLHRERGADLCIEKFHHQEGIHGLILSACDGDDDTGSGPEEVRRFEDIISHARRDSESRYEAEELLAAVARNFLDPIRSLHQQAAHLLDPAPPGEPARMDALRKIAHTAAHLSDVIGNVVDYHLVAKSTVRDEIVDLESLVRLTTQNVFPDLSPGTLTIGAMPAVRADPGLLIRALSHLINFACDHRKPEEPLRVCLGFSHTQKSFVLSDNGIGVDMGLINKLVNIPLADAHSLDTGLVLSGRSLAVAKKIIKMHGGAFEVISMRGVGTTCYFQLPLATNLEASF